MLAGDVVTQVSKIRRVFEEKNPLVEQTPLHAIVKSVHHRRTDQACSKDKIGGSAESGAIVPKTRLRASQRLGKDVLGSQAIRAEEIYTA